MLFLRNPEIKKMLICYGIFTVAAMAGALFFSGDLTLAVYVLAVCLGALAIFLYHTARRYRKISHLSGQLDRILHGVESACFVPDEEGELALLASEIYKMTVRLQEQTELLQQDKDYLSSSMADISHQIKTPLTSIRMIVPRLGRTDISEEQKLQYVRDINTLLSRMEWLVSSLLKIARLETGTVAFEEETVPVQELVQKALAPLDVMLDVKGIALAVDISPEASFCGDMSWSVEAVGNILKNCMEHLPEGGTLTITAEENPLYTGIRISDNGPGITPEDLPHLFERFYQGKRSGADHREVNGAGMDRTGINHAGMDHAGIGLALAQMIVNRQNGMITAKNGMNHGAEFQIRFYKGAV